MTATARVVAELGVLIGGWMKSWRGKIVAMVIMIVIVLLSSAGGGYLRVGMCCWGVGGEGEIKIA